MHASMHLPGRATLTRPDAGWFLTLFPAAGEAGGSFVSSRRPPRSVVRPGHAADPDRARAEAARRAGVKLRRYCVANRLDRMGTLTYAGDGCHDPRQVRADVAGFFRSLRTALGGRPIPYVWVPEWHKSHGLHLHYAMGRYVRRSLIEQAWGRGWVYIHRLSDLPVGSTSVHESRATARYLSKYVSKAFADPDRLAGLHRYEVAQSFQPTSMRLAGRSSEDALAQAVEVMGAEPAVRWSSDQKDGWQGPPLVWFQWDRVAS